MIRQARKLAGIDQSQLALLSGVSRRSVVVVESLVVPDEKSGDPKRIDPRRRAVLERIRRTFEREFMIAFDPETGKVWRRRRRASRRAKG